MWPGPPSKGSVISVPDWFPAMPFLVSLPTGRLQKTFLFPFPQGVNKLLLFHAGLIYWLSLSYMGGDREQWGKRASAAGKLWVFTGQPLAHTGGHTTKLEEGSRGFSSPAALAIMILFVSPASSPATHSTTNGFSSGPPNPGVSKVWPTAA